MTHIYFYAIFGIIEGGSSDQMSIEINGNSAAIIVMVMVMVMVIY